jgi:ATP-dependent DNA helicase RecG
MGHEMNVYNAVRKELSAGHQAYFVYPRIEGENTKESSVEDERQNLKSAENMYRVLSEQIYPEYKCALVHSNVDEDEQNKILSDFKNGKVQVLIATTVVEVGVDVGNATCMVIEHADRFGLAALHQLRGRVGRSALQSYCYLIYSQNITEIGIQRMKVLRQSTDGFHIAEEDLRLRGPGEFSGTAQSGYLTFAIADISRDKEILMQARTDAFDFLRQRMKKDGSL